jgi:uncharacterized protein (DUF983 family)
LNFDKNQENKLKVLALNNNTYKLSPMKKSKLYSIIFNKCPRCHEGQFFVTNNPYDLKRFQKMHEHCPHCSELLMREPGFYIGAMYVSYAISVVLTAIFFFGFVIGLGLPLYLILGSLIFLIVLLMPLSFRLSRLVWINIFVDYDKLSTK